MKAQKIFADGFKVKAKIINTKSVFSVNIQADRFSEFIKSHKNEKGYVPIDCWELDQPDKYGHTHNASLNQWTPTPKVASSQDVPQDDDLPF